MFKHNLHITIHAKDQKTITDIFNNISNDDGVFFGEGEFMNGSLWECKKSLPLNKKIANVCSCDNCESNRILGNRFCCDCGNDLCR